MEHIRSVAYAKNLVLLKDELSQASLEIGWFGRKVVVFQGDFINGSIPLNQLVLNVSIAAYERMQAGNLTLEERVIGLDLSDKLKKFYANPDFKKSPKTIFSLLLSLFQCLQDFYNYYFLKPHPCLLTGPSYWRNIASPRRILENGRVEKFFRLYHTEEQLLKDFGNAPITKKPLKRYLVSKDRSRWAPEHSFFVEEKQIRLLGCAWSQSYQKPTAEMIESITFERCKEDCSCNNKRPTKLSLGNRMILDHTDFCAEGCIHECSIKLKDGREQYAQTVRKMGGID